MIYTASLKYGLLRHRTLTFNFDMLAWFILYDEFGWDFEKIGQVDRNEVMGKMLFAAAKSHAINSGESFTVTLPKIVRILERSRTAESEKLKEVFAKSAADIPSEMQEKFAEGKKKQHGMTS